ncbi:MAG: hypothetical protein O3B08_03100 [Proteobacteria bacterium]|nr:hypothetical protein [Pseudomonadota bacterium]
MLGLRRTACQGGGWFENRLRQAPTGLRIAGRKIVLLEDVIDGSIDLHQI